MSGTKSVVITGGERGIGRVVAERFLSKGWRTAILGVDLEAAGAFLQSLDESKSEALRFFQTDVSEFHEVEVSMKNVSEWAGEIDALVANAGIAGPKRYLLDEIPIQEWDRVIAVNLSGVFHSAKAAAPRIAKRGGSIVTIASTRASMSEPNTFAYTASKGGVVALTHSLAASLGPRIRVNCISPGWINTGPSDDLTENDHAQHWVGRVGVPRDIAELAYFLCGDGASFITGQEFVVDGGMTKKMIYE